jgi:hypothetical protein
MAFFVVKTEINAKEDSILILGKHKKRKESHMKAGIKSKNLR